jgi:dihydroorotase-like cyclic amidohydrolase
VEADAMRERLDKGVVDFIIIDHSRCCEVDRAEGLVHSINLFTRIVTLLRAVTRIMKDERIASIAPLH